MMIKTISWILIAAQANAAITSVGSFISKANTTSGDPITFTTTATLEAGNIGVCAIGVDNDGNGTEGDIVALSDEKGNTWAAVGLNEIDPGAAAAGAYVGLFWTKATTELTSGDDITIDLGAARTSKAISCWEFTVGAGNTLSTEGSESEVDNTNSDAGSISVGSLTNVEHLWVRAIASETTNGAIGTQTTSYSVFTSSTGRTGTEATSMGVGAEFIITTNTTSTSDPTMSDTTADRASTMRAFTEISSKRRIMVVQ